jgi:hypothetical protein
VAYAFDIKLNALKHEVLCVIKEIAEKDIESWRVVKLSESDIVSISDDRGFEQIDVLVKSYEPHIPVSVVNPIRLAVISRLSSSELRCSHMFKGGPTRPPVKASLGSGRRHSAYTSMPY